MSGGGGGGDKTCSDSGNGILYVLSKQTVMYIVKLNSFHAVTAHTYIQVDILLFKLISKHI